MTDLNPLQIATRRHAAADSAIRLTKERTYGRINGGFRGCSVGCLAYEIAPEEFDHYENGWIDGADVHQIVADASGAPKWVIHLQDAIFEGLPDDEASAWHIDLHDAIAGFRGDWQDALHNVCIAILDRAMPHAGRAEPALRRVRDLHAAKTPASDPAWLAAAESAASAAAAADSAARSAARSAEARSAEAWAESSAEAAARSAEWAAESSAEWAAESSAEAAAMAAEWAADSAAAAARSAEARSAEAWAAEAWAWLASYLALANDILSILRADQYEIPAAPGAGEGNRPVSQPSPAGNEEDR